MILNILIALAQPTASYATEMQENIGISNHNHRNYYLGELYRSYSTCVIHLIDLIGNLELAPPALPVIVDGWSRQCKLLANNFNDIGGIIDTIAQSRLKYRPRTYKLQHLSCFVTFIVAQERLIRRSKLVIKNGESSALSEALRMLLCQDFTLWLDSPWNRNAGTILSESPVFFPESIVYLSENSHISLGYLESELADLDLTLFYPSAAHLPTILLISINKERPEENCGVRNESCDPALLFCLYCEANKKFVPLDSAHSIKNAEQTASRSIGEVPWITFDREFYWKIRVQPCPFTLRTAGNELCTAEHLSIADLAFAGLTSTAARKTPDVTAKGQRFPRVTSGGIRSRIEFIFPQTALQFGFITSDNVYQASSGLNSFPLMQPFGRHVWIAIAIASIAVVVVSFIAIHVSAHHVSLEAASSWLFSVTMVLFSQVRMPAIRKNSVGHFCSRVDSINWKLKLLWAAWLLSVALLASSYSAVFNSNYILEPIYTRDWSLGLGGLENFTFILAFDDPSVDGAEDGLSGMDCYRTYKMVLSPDARDSCFFFYEYIDMKNRESGGILYNNYHEPRHILEGQIQLWPLNKLRKIIGSSLMAPKPVFVSPSQYLDSDWELFRVQMRAHKALKFATHFDQEDTSLMSIRSYGFTRGLHWSHNKVVPRRLKTVVTSGLLGLWRKWDTVRKKFRQRGNKTATGVQLFLPLSLYGSDMYFIFVLFVLCLAACLGAFLLETCFNYVYQILSAWHVAMASVL